MNTQNSSKSKPKRILGVDYGMSRLGLALSDERKIIAMPLSTLKAEKRSEHTATKLIETIALICESHHCVIEKIVIGLPLMMSGRTGLLANEVKHFVQLLIQGSPIPIQTWDERLTTVQAERSLREGNLTRKKRTKMVDTVSATLILQSYLDSQNLAPPLSFP